MKKMSLLFVTVILFFSLSVGALSEDLDLSALSYEQLTALENRIIQEMVSRPEYKEVIVPLGTYKVGEDIPAGKWTLSGLKDDAGIVYWGKGLDEYGVEIPFNMKIADFAHFGEEDSISWELVEGTYIVVTIGAVKFSPYIPKSLGF